MPRLLIRLVTSATVRKYEASPVLAMMESSWSSRWAARRRSRRWPRIRPTPGYRRRAASGPRHEPAPQAQITLGVESAPLGQHRGRVQQLRHRGVPGGPVTRDTIAGVAADPRRDRGHLRTAGEVGPGVAPGQVASEI